MKITLATKFTIARIFLIVPTMVMFIVAQLCPPYAKDPHATYIALSVVAAVMFGVCCATDFVDGYIARKTNTVSNLGKFLDPLADKVVIVIMLFLIVLFKDGLTMGGVFNSNPLIVALFSGIILSRELMIGVFRSIAASKGSVLAADIFGKIKTVCLDVGVTILMLSGLHVVVGWIGTVLFYIGTLLTLYSGVNYLYRNRHVLRDEEANDTKSPQSDNAQTVSEEDTASADEE